MSEKKSVFETLNKINVNNHKEEKNGLSYLSWAWAWAEVKTAYPDATYTIYENPDGLFYHHDGKTAWVKTGVTIEGIEMVEYLPVMDYRNKSIPINNLTSFDVNKSIQRSLTKACARHGLGLYIYAGEDLPNETPEEVVKRKLKDVKIELPTSDDFSATLENLSEKDPITTEQANKIVELCEEISQPLSRVCKAYNKESIYDLSAKQACEVLEKLENAKK